jgi:hypothetical protein
LTHETIHASVPPKGKGKGGKGGSKGKGKNKKGKGGSKGKGGKGGYYDDYYTDDYYDDKAPEPEDDFLNVDDEMTDDAGPAGPGGCQLVSFNETFVVPVAALYLAPDTTESEPGNPDLPGTLFIFERTNILEPDGVTPIAGTRVSGTCTRTTVGSDGGGTCNLVFIDDEEFTINVAGFLAGPFGSSLAISGGTGGMVGVIGEMDIFPIYSNGTSIDGDVFLDPLRYEVIADLGLIVCE